MPYKNKSDRNYKHEYAEYQGTAQQKKNRAERNAARRAMMKAGKVHKGDGEDVNHIKPLSKGGSNKKSNWNVQTAHNNRSYPRKKDHSIK